MSDIIIRHMREADLQEAERVIRLAFGTFMGHDNPEDYRSDARYANPRYSADSSASFVAESNGKIVGSNFGLHWGSVGIFGPLTVHPEYWNKEIGSKLMEPVMKCFQEWKVTHSGAMTFANSPKHINLYRKFGYHPRFLIPVMSKKVESRPIILNSKLTWAKYSECKENQDKYLDGCNQVSNTVYPGLDLELEIKAVDKMNFGETVILFDKNKEITGFAICHCGKDTEAGNDKCYVKFGAVKANFDAQSNFVNLLNACEELTIEKEISSLTGGVNAGRYNAYQSMLNQNFCIDFLGVSLHQPNNDAYNIADRYVIDDWR
ncbi:MAG: GNAT family N-acetyltransferase [Nitrosopumilus sp.]|nr:GNAT family N-acetyltransferase [Nitrosopumilus sp.]